MEWMKVIPLIAALVAAVLGLLALLQADWMQASAFFLAALVCDRILR